MLQLGGLQIIMSSFRIFQSILLAVMKEKSGYVLMIAPEHYC